MTLYSNDNDLCNPFTQIHTLSFTQLVTSKPWLWCNAGVLSGLSRLLSINLLHFVALLGLIAIMSN